MPLNRSQQFQFLGNRASAMVALGLVVVGGLLDAALPPLCAHLCAV